MKKILSLINLLILLGIVGLLYRLLPPGSARGREPALDNPSHRFVRGDADDNGVVDLTDGIFTLSYLFLGERKPPCMAAADATDNGEVDIADPILTLTFLFLGGVEIPPPHPLAGPDPTPDLGCREPPFPPLPPAGSAGGPDRELTPEEAASWRRGRAFFNRPATLAQGLGPLFNGDSCRGCHLDPVIGGAGGLDVNVLRFARVDENGEVSQVPGGPAVSRQCIQSFSREEMPEEANVIEPRQTPTVFGLGLIDRVPEAALLANADPADLDGDGISGRARTVNGKVGRFGHKCGVPGLADFAADALMNELGLTVDPVHSPFAGVSDADGAADPEVSGQDFADLVFYMSHLAPPQRRLPDDPAGLDRVQGGEQAFLTAGCARCHVPELAGEAGPVRAYSNFLLHQVADPARRYVNEPGVEPGEFRTAPLWGLRDTPPYLHDGSAETVREAILKHRGEAEAARQAFQALSSGQQQQVEEFLLSL
ncbi:MAG: hypothetical protein HY717_20420 [Planctomycetes bacterium]|nr:hypothetical protein [Planctomycetota bacterium]